MKRKDTRIHLPVRPQESQDSVLGVCEKNIPLGIQLQNYIVSINSQSKLEEYYLNTTSNSKLWYPFKKWLFLNQRKVQKANRHTLSYPSCRTSSSLLVRMCFRNFNVKPDGVLLLSLSTHKQNLYMFRRNSFQFPLTNFSFICLV